jgi:transposase
MKSTGGRPRLVTDAQIEVILRWHKEVLAIRKLVEKVKTIRQLAKELGLSRGVISDVIARRGIYKQPSPEHRAAEIGKRKRRIARLRENGFL